MKASRLIITAILFLSLFSASLPALSDSELRKDFFDVSQKEVLALAFGEVSPDVLGDWKSIIDGSLFMIFRQTELYRGKMYVMVVENSAVISKLYPDGTFVLSTGLLDYIDNAVFNASQNAERRIRDFTTEREKLLVPFLIIEASHFALDHAFAAYKRNLGFSGTLQPSETENLEADRFSMILLPLAGYSPSILEGNILSLTPFYKTDSDNTFISSYLNNRSSPEKRTASLLSESENILKNSADFALVLSNLRSFTAFDETLDLLENLREMYPSAHYISRLQALTLHRQWLETVPPPVQKLKTFFPVADETDPSRTSFLSLFSEKTPAFPQGGGMRSQSIIPGDNKIYIAAVDAYKRALESYRDSGLASSYAMLLLWSGNADIRKTALTLAEEAFKGETNMGSFTARANYGSMLYLTGSDFVKAQYLYEPKNESVSSFYLDQGSAGDERDLLLNSALILRSLGDLDASRIKKEKLDLLLMPSPSPGTLALRQIYIGNSTDVLIEKWGYPSSIVYNYFTENWQYAMLSASVLVARDGSNASTQRVKIVRLGALSPVSPGGEIRVGDARADFEAKFGKKVYKAADREVYIKDGNRISVLYLSDTIRGITLD